MARSTATSKTKKSTGSKKKSGTTNRTPSRARKNTPQASRSRNPVTTKTAAPRKKITQPAPTPLSAERKVDIAGIVMVVIGLLTLVSLLTANSGGLTLIWTNFLQRWIGWGAYALPLVLLLIGAWFLLSKMERFPGVSSERVIGVVLVFFNLLTWFQLLDVSFSGVSTPAGGGILGGGIYRALEDGLGKAGTIIVLVAWLLVALVLLIDLSMSDLVSWLAEKFKHSHSRFANFLRKKAEERRRKAEGLQEINEAEELEGVTHQTGPIEPVVSSSVSSAMTSEAGTPVKTWVLPEPEEILNPIQTAPVDEESDEDKARVIEETLRSFNAPGKVVEIRRGPAITMFGVEPEYNESRNGRTRVRVSNITRLGDDLAMALKASRIRIQAPVPGKGYVGIEVPNLKTSMVSMLELVTSLPYQNNKSTLKFALGKDVTGVPTTTDLTAMPHLLIAGTTGSGKSVCVNAILTGYLLSLNPDQLRLLLVDPKRVEFSVYNGILTF